MTGTAGTTDIDRQQSKAGTEIRGLTGLRWVAAFMVFVDHASDGLGAGAVRDVVHPVGEHGFIGVSFFFILSGLVLTWVHRDSDRPGTFYQRRVARILPLYWLCLAIAVMVKVGVASAGLRAIAYAVPAAAGLQAWIPNDKIYFAGDGAEWSISTEVFFYAAFPLLILLTRSRRGMAALAAAAVVTVLAAPLLLHPTVKDHQDISHWAIYIFPVTRLGEFILGMLIATALIRGWRLRLPVTAALALAAAAYLLTYALPYWLQPVLVTIIPLGLLLASVSSTELEGRVGWLGSKVMHTLGVWSFAFYLIHPSVLKVVREVFLHAPSPDSAPMQIVRLLVAFAVSLTAAWLLHTRVEQPLVRKLRPDHRMPVIETA